jgi:hypothetical protein
MPLLLIFILTLFAFITCVIQGLGSYFKESWRWFWVMVVCILISGWCVFVELSQMLIAPPSTPSEMRPPTSPL